MARIRHWPLEGETLRDFERRLRAEGMSKSRARQAAADFKRVQAEREARPAPTAPAPRARLLGG